MAGGDTAGQERFRRSSSYIRDSSVAVVVSTSPAAGFYTTRWIDEVRTKAPTSSSSSSAQTDLAERREVSVEEGDERARETGALFVEASAKAGFNVKALFRKIAAALPAAETKTQAGGADARKSEEALVDVKLTAAPVAQASSCQC